jgi:gamma-glutamyltranspeptidase/glutathione hydrolase/leukotriene-C4 hydrolase
MIIRIPPEQTFGNTRDSNKSEVWSLNFREVAPALSNKTMYKDNPMASRIGGLAVAIPGEVRGLQEAHRRWGSIPWKELVDPSVELAAGWRVQSELAGRIQVRTLSFSASFLTGL